MSEYLNEVANAIQSYNAKKQRRSEVESIFGDSVASKKPAKNGWAPGWYTCTCRYCEKPYTGEKRSYECSTCGYDETIDRKSLFDLTKSEVKEINDLVEKVFKTKDQFHAEIAELKVTIELLLSALEEGFNSVNGHDLNAWEDKTKALIKELREERL